MLFVNSCRVQFKMIGVRNKNIVYPELSYKITGLLFKTHNQLGRYCKEKQYQDIIEEFLRGENLKFEREKQIAISSGSSGNIADFIIENKIILECKAKPFITKQDYYQLLRYLKSSGMRLGMLVNFRNRFLKPRRILN